MLFVLHFSVKEEAAAFSDKVFWRRSKGKIAMFKECSQNNKTYRALQNACSIWALHNFKMKKKITIYIHLN